MLRLLQWTAAGLILICVTPVQAQITAPRTLSAQPRRLATLEEQLTNRLRATTQEQRDYIKFVVNKVLVTKQLDAKLVVAIERYALRRNPHFPFPFFERALRYEANKRGVPMPTVQQFASTKTAPRIRR